MDARSLDKWGFAAFSACLAAGVVLGCSDDPVARTTADSPRPSLTVSPSVATPGELVELVVEGPGAESRGSTSYFQVRSADGWDSRFTLNSDLPGRPADARPFGDGSIGVGLGPETPDRVLIPDVPPGDYRIMKRLLLDPDSSELLPVFGSIEVSG